MYYYINILLHTFIYTYYITLYYRFLPTFAITDSGLSRPKILICEGSDGKCYIICMFARVYDT